MPWNNKKNTRQRSQKRRDVSGLLSGFAVGFSRRHIIGIGRFLGWVAYNIDIRHRRIVRRNLHFAYPQWSPERIQKVSRCIFQNAGVTVLESCQAFRLSKKDILRNIHVQGEKNLEDAIAMNKGVILISAHLGNWEIANLFLSCYLKTPLTMVARKIRPPRLHQLIYAFRTKFGNIIIDKKNALLHMKKALRQGKILGLLIDQNTTRGEGVEIEFFGRKVTATPAAALLARRYDCPVVLAYCVRKADGELSLIINPPFILKKTKNLRADLQENTQVMNSAIEEAVRTYPEQWFWFHKRWKRYYPFLYPEDLAKRQRRRAKRKAKAKNNI